jgi:hypothetical protein
MYTNVMAAIAIPIIAAALPIVTPFLQSVFVHLQGLFGKGDPANALKINTAVGAVTPLLAALQAAGIIPGTATADQIMALVQSAFTSIKGQGFIPDVVSKVTPASATGTAVSAPATVGPFSGSFVITVRPA